jgi:hypothetical protein
MCADEKIGEQACARTFGLAITTVCLPGQKQGGYWRALKAQIEFESTLARVGSSTTRTANSAWMISLIRSAYLDTVSGLDAGRVADMFGQGDLAFDGDRGRHDRLSITVMKSNTAPQYGRESKKESLQ